MSDKLKSLQKKALKSIAEAVDYQNRNNSGLAEYNAFLVHQLLKSISEELAEHGTRTADEYFEEFKQHEVELREKL